MSAHDYYSGRPVVLARKTWWWPWSRSEDVPTESDVEDAVAQVSDRSEAEGRVLEPIEQLISELESQLEEARASGDQAAVRDLRDKLRRANDRLAFARTMIAKEQFFGGRSAG